MSVKEVVLNFTEGENEGVEIKLSPPRVIRIGRSEESDVFLGEKKISRKHCILHLGEEALSISDLESTNGTFVNSKRIHEQLLENGDRVRIGSSVMEVNIELLGDSQEASTSAKIKSTQAQKISHTEDIQLDFDVDQALQPPASELSKTVNITEFQQKSEDDPDMVVEYHDSSLEIPAMPNSESQDLDFKAFQVEPTTGGVQAPLDPTSMPLDSDEFTLDKIPEIQEISDVLDSEIEFVSQVSSPPPQTSHKKKNKALSGDFSAMGLPDLLQNLNQNQKTGRLNINSDGQGKGEILILEGATFSAKVGKALGSKAIYRMLGWTEGDFEFKPLDKNAPDFGIEGGSRMKESIDGLLMEGMRQLDEINKIRDVLPQMSSNLELNPSSDVPLSKLHPKVLDVVQLTMVHKKMSDVMDLSPLNDLETAKIIFYLVKKNMLKVS